MYFISNLCIRLLGRSMKIKRNYLINVCLNSHVQDLSCHNYDCN